MYVSSPQSLVNVPDAHNISYAFENKQKDDKLCVIRKKMPVAIEIQDGKVCEAIRKYNLKVGRNIYYREIILNIGHTANTNLKF